MPDHVDLLKLILEGVSEGVYAVDGEGRVAAVNRRLAELLGLPPDLLRPGDRAEKLAGHLRSRSVSEMGASADKILRLLAEAPAQSFSHACVGSGGRMLEIRTNPASGGGFALVVADVTAQQAPRASPARRRGNAGGRSLEDLLRTSLDRITDGFAIYDASDRLVMMNKIYLGYPPGDADAPRLGITFEELMEEDRRRDIYPDAIGDGGAFIAGRVAAHREGAGRLLTFRTVNGWAQARDYRLPDGSTVVVRSDVSELVERDRALRESQASLTAAQRIARLGSWELDLIDPADMDKNSWRWSDETFRIFGYRPGQVEASSENFFRAVHPEDRDRLSEAIRHAIDTGDSYSIEHRLLRPDGQEVIVQAKSDVVAGPDGRRPVRLVGTIQDVTEQRAAERRRDELRALLEATSEASPDGILLTDARGHYLFWNERLREMWNLSPEYMAWRRSTIGDSETLLVPYTEQIVEPGPFIEEIRRMYDRNQPLTPALRDIVLKDGRVFLRHGGRVAAGKLPYATVAWIYRDVTEQRKRDAELAQTQRLTTVGDLSSGLAHELNNLLMEIGGNLELIEMQAPDSCQDPGRGPNGDFIKAARSAVDRGAELIRYLLAFSRRQPLAPRLTDVNELIADAMKILPRLLGAPVTMTFAAGPGIWRTVVDPGFLRSALVSLAANARDAMPRGGSLVIETGNRVLDEADAGRLAEVAAGDYVLIAITDDGVGMSPEVAKRAFEPFFTTKPVGKGTGLGLSVVYGFVKQSGGHVTIDSREGRGTSVRIYLPRALPEATGETLVPAADGAAGNGSGRYGRE